MTTNYEITLNTEEKLPILRVPPTDEGPLLVIIPSIFGISPDVVEFSERFAQEGALVYVLDSFWRSHPGPLQIPEQTQLALQRRREVNPENVFSDLIAAIEHGKSEALCNGSVILLGICFGGKFALSAPITSEIQAVAAWHGGGLLSVLQSEGILSALQNVDIELDFGEADPMIPLTEVQKIRGNLQNIANVNIRTHPNSGHGFSHIGTAKGNEKAAKIAVKNMINLVTLYQK